MTERLRIEYVPLVNLRPNPWNPNRQDDATFERERRSIREHGFVDPTPVRDVPPDERGIVLEIIDGEHRWRAAGAEGHVEVPIINLGPLPDAAARRLTIKLNDLRGHPDPMRLAELLRDLGEPAAALAEELPYTEIEIDSLVRSLEDFDWTEQKVKDRSMESQQRWSKPGQQERRFQLGGVRGLIPASLCDQLIAEWESAATEAGSRSAESVLPVWLRRLRAAQSPSTTTSP